MTPVELVIFVGLQGSGKSTFFRERFGASHAHVSKDNFRRARNRNVRQQRLIEEALTRGQSVVVDNTNPQVADRAPLIAQGQAHGARVVGYFFPPDVPGNLRRNAERTGKARVPDHAIFITAAKLEAPSLAEGYDELWLVTLVDGGGFRVVPWLGPPELPPGVPIGPSPARDADNPAGGTQPTENRGESAAGRPPTEPA